MAGKDIPIFSLTDLREIRSLSKEINDSLYSIKNGQGSMDEISGKISKLMDIYLNLQKRFVSVSILSDISEIFNKIESMGEVNEKDDALLVYNFNKKINEIQRIAEDLGMKINLIERNYVEIPDGIKFEKELREALVNYQIGNILSAFLILQKIVNDFLNLKHSQIEGDKNIADIMVWAKDNKILNENILARMERFQSALDEEKSGIVFSMILDLLNFLRNA